MTRFVLSDHSAEALRSVAKQEEIDPDNLVLMWCVAAGYEVKA